MYNAPQYHANSGFADLLSHEVVINAVHDGRVWAMSFEWFQTLPDELQEQVKRAGELTTQDNAERNSELRQNAVEHLQEAGMEFHIVEGDRLEQWKDAIAYDRNDEWNDLMDDVFPSDEAQTRLEEATQEESDIQIDNLENVL
jgi:TRAP-type C4-dicarboxylate transport system substrate-binding protein